MSPRFKGQWRPSLFKLMLMFSLNLLVAALLVSDVGETAARGRFDNELMSATGHSSSSSSSTVRDQESDPMEPCYLANNRASESLTISESTPVGTVVGEIMVNGDSSANGNIELSIKMPGGSGQLLAGSARSDATASASGRQPVGTQRQQQQQTNGPNSAYSSALPLAATKRIGSSAPFEQPTGAGRASISSAKATARELSNLIDLMPPLSIDHATKQLILAKKLDRENLDRYIMAGGFQSASPSSSSLSSLSSSSASLTVHVKCQLKAVPTNGTTTASLAPAATKKNSNTNSILIPVHLIVTDENDNWPVFLNSPYIVDLNESAQSGSTLTDNEIIAVDGDQQGPLSTIEYSIVRGSFWSDSFGFLNPLDSRSLVVKDNRLLDYESQPRLTLRVMARDQGDPPNWAITPLHINLLDSDDLSPVFGEDNYYGQVRDNRPGEVIELLPKRMAARDGDKTINAPVVYSFHTKTNHSIHFDLDPDLGQLTLRKTLPDEPAPGGQPFCLLVKAAQVDNPQRWSLAMVNMRLSHANPNLASIQLEQLRSIDSQALASSGLKFAHSNVTLEVSESAPPGFTVHRMKASFNHQASPTESDQILYHLLDDEMKYFNLDERSGRLSLNRSLDFELLRHVSVRVLATYEYQDDGSRNIRPYHDAAYPKMICDVARVNVKVINENDFEPEFSHEQYNFQLSVSDLITSFEPPKSAQESSDTGGDSKDVGAKQVSKRFGDLDLDEFLEEPLEWPAMPLGQVYCADRDYGDKVTLQLVGSKADLFHLTQAGRLYLPLVNVSASASPSPSSTARRNDPFSGFSQNRLASSRRIEPAHSGQDPPDRKYLNHLLAEFSNLGRLRLKVLATDDGRPKVHQSKAIIVITIVTIENFIIRKAPQPPYSPSVPAGAISDGPVQLTNETSYDVNQPETSRDHKVSGSSTNQVMMIPATSGRSFVQINPDIITNLIAQSATHQQSSSFDSSPIGGNLSQTLNPRATTMNASVENSTKSPGSNSASKAAGGESALQSLTSSSRFQPPSLLLVDDDGAKFVAMPAAIEVYNQQVQEAADLNARERSSNAIRRSSGHENSLWDQLKGYFQGAGSPDKESPRSSYNWLLNLSTAIMLHLVGFALIITLATKIRSSIRNSSGFNASLWPATLSSVPRLFRRPSNGRSVVSIFDQPASCTYSARPSSETSEGSGYAFLAHRAASSAARHPFVRGEQTSQGSEAPGTNYLMQQSKMVSRGTVVSAISSGHGLKCAPPPPPQAVSKFNDTAEVDQDSKHQDLFSHLKVTLDKMLESSEESEETAASVGQVTVTTPDADSVGRGSNDSCGKKYANQPTVTSQASPKHNSDTVVEVKASKSSTFVGLGNQRSPANIYANQGESTIVSINVSAQKKSAGELNSSPAVGGFKKLPTSKSVASGANSSSSSVVSLASTSSSSISNKINAAVERTITTGSDVSSLDSTILFNRAQPGSPSSNYKRIRDRHEAASAPKLKPPPPPPPPPPALAKVPGRRACFEDQQRDGSPQSASVSKLHASRPFSNLSDGELASTTASAHVRRPLPQNPIHIKLRQQALSERAQFATEISSIKRGRSNFQENQSQASSKQQSHLSVACKKGVHRASVEAHALAQPPTPPPLPAQLPAPAIKTASPTTSVDRGYESFHSYTSSSQQQPRASGADRRQINDLTQKSESGSDSSTTSRTGRSLPAIPAPPSASMPPTKDPVIGRHGRFTASTSQRAQQQGSPQQSRNQTHGQSMRVAMSLARLSKPPEDQASFGGSARFERALQATTAVAKHRNALSTMTRADSTQPKGGCSQARSSQHYTSSDQPAGMVNCDTEDEDFYYCCNQTQIQTTTSKPGLLDQYDGANSLLKDYASHTYKLHGRAAAHVNDSDLMVSKPMPSYQTTNADLQYNYDNFKKHHYQPVNNRHQPSSRHQQQHHISQLANNGHGSKKQLTWSDQVEIA